MINLDLFFKEFGIFMILCKTRASSTDIKKDQLQTKNKNKNKKRGGGKENKGLSKHRFSSLPHTFLKYKYSLTSKKERSKNTANCTEIFFKASFLSRR